MGRLKDCADKLEEARATLPNSGLANYIGSLLDQINMQILIKDLQEASEGEDEGGED